MKQEKYEEPKLRMTNTDKYNNKKELLKRYAKKHSKKLSTKNISQSKNKVNSDKEKLAFKKQIKELQKQLQSEKQNNQNQASKYKSRLRNLKQANHQLRNEHKIFEKEKQNFYAEQKIIEQDNIKKYGELISSFNYLEQLGFDINNPIELKKLKEHYNNQLFNFIVYMMVYEQNYQKLRTNASIVNKHRRDWELRVNKFNLQVKSYKGVLKKNQKEIAKLKHRVKVLKENNNYLQNKIFNFEHHFHDIPNMLSYLLEHVTTNNINSFEQLSVLNQRVHDTFNQKATAKEQYTVHKKDELIYGYVLNKDGKHYLTNNTNNLTIEFSADVHQSKKLKDGIAIAIKKNKNHEYYLVRFYPIVDWLNHELQEHGSVNLTKSTINNKGVKALPLLHINTTNNKQRKNISNNKIAKENVQNSQEEIIRLTDKRELSWLKQQKVLIIGNKNVKEFSNQVKKYCVTDTIDAYEKSLQLIFTQMRTHNIIFILKGSVPHSITNYIKINPILEKSVQYFYTPKKYDGVNRLHLVYSNKEENND